MTISNEEEILNLVPKKERKASDILLEVISKQDQILGFIRNIDYTNKLLLNKIKNLENKPSEVKVNSPQSSVSISDFEFPQVEKQNKSQLQLALEQDQLDQEEEEMLLTEANQEGRRRTQRITDTIKKIPVEQRVVYADGKNVYMANVEIFDNSGNLIKKTRTNQVGKWLAGLAAGIYFVKIEKAATTLKTKVELKYSVTIPDSDSRVELETQKA